MTEGNKVANSGSNGVPVKAVTAGSPANMYQQMNVVNAVMNHQSQAHQQSNGVYLNPHAAAAAAFTAAAQQLVQAQMQQQQQPLANNVVSQQTNNAFKPQGKPNGQQNTFTISRSNSNSVVTPPPNMQLGVQVQQNAPIQVPVDSSNVSSTNAFAQASLSQGQHPNVTSNSTQAPSPANVLLNPQQLALSAQAQAAAILAAGSINPSLMLNAHQHAHQHNPSASNPAAMAAAQVVASLLQSQAAQSHSLQQTRLNEPSSQAHIQELKATPVQTTAASNLHHAQSNVTNIASLKSPISENGANFSAFNASIPETSRSMKRNNSVDAPTSSNASAATNQSLFVAAAAAANNPVLLTQMRNWKLDQLEAHVKLIQDANQPIPQPISLLLAEARRREEKRTAKRVANRKSACTSRARKKALVEEMTRTNAKLRRQALILALLPDMVIAIQVNGDITFCSAQVERVLRHSVEDLVGSNVSQILVPSSRESLNLLIEKMVLAEQMALEDSKDSNDGSGGSSNSGGNDSGAAVVSLQSDQGFPMSVVKVRSHPEAIASDSSGGKSPSGDTQSSPSNSDAQSQKASSNNSNKVQGSSGDDSSSSSDAKNLHKANEALNRNVRWHNAQLLIKKVKATKSNSAHKDDVTGASVTANNADARLSSLQHKPKCQVTVNANTTGIVKKNRSNAFENIEDNSFTSSTDSLLAGVEEKRAKVPQRNSATNENASEDSGYRESREDTGLSESETSNTSNGRVSRLIPTCNVCLIKDDLSTIWCEVTSSIRTRSLETESESGASSGEKTTSNLKKDNREKKDIPSNANDVNSSGQMKELLLCLRPIREGKEPVGEDLRFTPKMQVTSSSEEATSVPQPSKLTHVDKPVVNIETSQCAVKTGSNKTRPMKKRPLPTAMSQSGKGSRNEEQRCAKKPAVDKSHIDAEQSVVESLMLMSSHNKK